VDLSHLVAAGIAALSLVVALASRRLRPDTEMVAAAGVRV